MSFTNQTLNAEHIVKTYKQIAQKVYFVLLTVDNAIARLKLAGMSVAIDTLMAEQRKNLASWEMGT